MKIFISYHRKDTKYKNRIIDILEANDIDTFTDKIWTSLNEDNKVSLFVRFIDIATGKYETRIVNKNK